MKMKLFKIQDNRIQPNFSTWGCIGAVGVVIVSNGIPLAKLLTAINCRTIISKAKEEIIGVY